MSASQGEMIDSADGFSGPAAARPEMSRPHTPGHGKLPAREGTGLLPWSSAEERLVRSHDYWLATVTPAGGPHLISV
jgi:hypothetical protein